MRVLQSYIRKTILVESNWLIDLVDPHTLATFLVSAATYCFTRLLDMGKRQALMGDDKSIWHASKPDTSDVIDDKINYFVTRGGYHKTPALDSAENENRGISVVKYLLFKHCDKKQASPVEYLPLFYIKFITYKITVPNVFNSNKHYCAFAVAKNPHMTADEALQCLLPMYQSY
jgi:hypothetical protein